MKHKTKGFIAMILALCLMMSLGIGALAEGQDHESDGPDPTGGNAVGGEMTDDRQEDGGPTTGDPGAPSVMSSKNRRIMTVLSLGGRAATAS